LLDHRVIIHAPDASSAKANLSSSWLRRIANFRNALKDLFAIQPSDGIVSAQIEDIREAAIVDFREMDYWPCVPFNARHKGL
jgi:uncharacterized protein (DUF1684 family)